MIDPRPDPAPSPDGSAGASPSHLPHALPKRSKPTHGVEIQSLGPTIVYLTVCTHRRHPWLANHRTHHALVTIWTDATAWLVTRYVLMPDHLHLFAANGPVDVPFDNWVRYWKSLYSKQYARPLEAWQADHWDRRLRSDDDYDEKWTYVRNNPVRAGLVRHPADWHYAGELHPCDW